MRSENLGDMFGLARLSVLHKATDSLEAHSVWLALVTMTTVGYGDFAPKSTSGYVITSILTVVSVLFIVSGLNWLS